MNRASSSPGITTLAFPTYTYHALGTQATAPEGCELLGQIEHASEGQGAGSAGRFVIAMPELLQPERAVQSWWAPGPLAQTAPHQVDGVQLQWRENANCVLLMAEGNPALAVRAQSRQLYEVMLSTLRRLGKAHPLRIWNYLARINELEDEEERYRLFNSGRRDAFRELGFGMGDGAPAACALGKRDGPLQVAVLAHAQAPRAVENPRQVNAYRYPAQYGADAPVFSRAAWVPASGAGKGMLLVSGTSSIVDHTTVHAGNVREQTQETLRNLRALLEAAQGQGAPAMLLSALEGRVYIRHAADAPAVREVLTAAGVTQLHYVQADVCRADLLVEIEAEAVPR